MKTKNGLGMFLGFSSVFRLRFFVLLLLGGVWLAPVSFVRAGTLTGRDVMVRVDNRNDGETRQYRMKLILINKTGAKRVRQVVCYQKDYGKDTKAIMIFESPADVKGTGYLSWEYDDETKDDDRWLYLPAMRKNRRISGSSSNDYFMGTDFTYDDLGGRNVDEDKHTLLREEELNSRKCWVVKSIPKEKDSEYTQKTVWVAQDLDMGVKVDYYNEYGLLKTLELKDVRQIDGIWTAQTMVMTNQQKEHQTIMEFADIKYNTPLKDNLFTIAVLERGNLKY